MPFPRNGRLEKLKAEADKAKADLVEVRGALMRILQALGERDQAVHEQHLAEDELRRSRDQIRLFIADRVIKHGPFAISDVEQDEAYQHSDQVQIVPDKEAGVTRFSLLEGIALRELPKKPLAAVPAPGTPDGNGTPEGADAPTTEPAQPLHAVDPDASKEQLPS